MAYTAIQTIALITAAIILLKVVLLFTSRKWLFNFGKKYYGNKTLIAIIHVALGAIIFAYLLVELTVVQVMAVSLFFALLYSLSLLRYVDAIMKNSKNFLRGFNIFEVIALLVWVGLSLGVIYELFFA